MGPEEGLHEEGLPERESSRKKGYRKRGLSGKEGMPKKVGLSENRNPMSRSRVVGKVVRIDYMD